MTGQDVLAVIDERTVCTGLQAKDKEEALAQMATMLQQAGYLQDTKAYLQDVYVREKQGVTGIGGYVAIPHGKSMAVQKTGVAIATLSQAISWETLDGKGVKVIVLFAVGAEVAEAKTHLKLLSLFARKLGKDEVIQALLQARNAKEVKQAFAQ